MAEERASGDTAAGGGAPARHGPPPRHVDYPDITVVESFERAVRAWPDRACTHFLGREHSYRDIAAQVNAAAAGLAGLGVRPGDRVAVLLPTCPENLVVTLAALTIGAQVVQHNPLYPTDELEPLFLDHEARVAVVWDQALAAVAPLTKRTPLRRVIGVDITRSLPLRSQLALRLPVAAARATRARLTAGSLPEGVLPWRRLLGRGERAPAHGDVVPGDVAVILYTSGTTGRPKGVPLTHANLMANCTQGVAWTGLKPGSEVFLAPLPMFHAFGLTVGVLLGITLGATLCMVPAPEARLMVDAVRRRQVTFAVGVPPLLRALLERAHEDGVSLRSLHSALSGAMSLPAEFVRDWEAATGGQLIEGYGLTETSPVIVGNPFDGSRRPGAIGIPFPDTHVRLVDPDEPAREVAPGDEGELTVRGPQVFAGYLERPEETAAAFVDGYFRTGDLAVVEDGFIRLTGRLKDIIVTGGFNVSPVEVEEVLRRHPRIADVAVVGLASPEHGEEVVAAVVPEGELPPTQELRAWAKQHLAAYKVPRRFLIVDEIPTNLLGKVVRPELVARLQGP